MFFALAAFLGLITSGVARGQIGMSARGVPAVSASAAPSAPSPSAPSGLPGGLSGGLPGGLSGGLSGAPDDAQLEEDARNDIVDIRHGRMPLRTRALGWTAEGAFVFRVTDCQAPSTTGAPECAVRLVVAAPGMPARQHLLFWQQWGEGDRAGCTSTDMGWPTQPMCWIDQAQASLFLATERTLRQQLGALVPAPSQARPFHLGTRRLALDTSEDPREPDALVRLVAVDGRDVQVLEVPMRQHPCDPSDSLCTSDVHLDRAQLLAVYEAPNGGALAVVSRFTFRMGRWWSGTSIGVSAFVAPAAAGAAPAN